MWVVEKVQPSHCSAGGPAGVPHLEAGDQLGPTVEDVDQRNRPVGTDQLRGRIDLDHGQAASLRGQCITGAGVGHFLDAEFIDPRLPLARSVTCGTGRLLVIDSNVHLLVGGNRRRPPRACRQTVWLFVSGDAAGGGAARSASPLSGLRHWSAPARCSI